MVNRVYLIPGKNIAIWNSWTPLVLANSKIITPENTISLTRYDNGVPVVYQVGRSDNPENFTQLIKNVTYFIEAKTAYWLVNAVSPGTAAEQSPAPIRTPTRTQTPTPTTTPVPAPAPEPAPVNASWQPLSDNLSSISSLVCTAFGLNFLALENSAQGRDKIGALSSEDLKFILKDLESLVNSKQPASDALSLLSIIGISNFAARLLILTDVEELRKLINFDELTVPLLSELNSKQPLNDELSAISALKTTDSGRQLLTLADEMSVLSQIGGVSAEELTHYAKLAADGTLPTSVLPSELAVLALLKTSEFGRQLLTLLDATSVRSQIGAASADDLAHYARLTDDGIVPNSLLSDQLRAIALLKVTEFGRQFLTLADAVAARRQIGAVSEEELIRYARLTEENKLAISLMPEELAALAVLTGTDFGRQLLTLVDAAAVRNRIGAISEDRLQDYARLSGDGTIPTSLLPNQYLVNVTSVNTVQEMLALTDLQPGDTVIRRDLTTRKIFTLVSLPASDLGNWERNALGIQTLNGQSGPLVNLAAADVGADEAGAADRVNQSLITHKADFSNPHKITPAIIGAELAGSAARVYQFLTAHQNDTNNPHLITLAQIGAEPAGAVQEHEKSVNHPSATVRSNGLMAAADKAKLDAIAADNSTRKTAVFKTDVLAAQQVGNYSVGLAKSFNLLRVATNAPCRLRIYSSAAYRTADSARAIGVDIKPGSGLVSEVIFAGQFVYDLDSTFGSSVENSDMIAIAVTNTTSSPAAITVTLTYLKLE